MKSFLHAYAVAGCRILSAGKRAFPDITPALGRPAQGSLVYNSAPQSPSSKCVVRKG